MDHGALWQRYEQRSEKQAKAEVEPQSAPILMTGAAVLWPRVGDRRRKTFWRSALSRRLAREISHRPLTGYLRGEHGSEETRNNGTRRSHGQRIQARPER